MKIKLLDRNSLKAFFSAGARPKESNFASLIDSMVNKIDDGISKTPEDGLILSPQGKESDHLISFYDNIEDELAEWSIALNQSGDKGLSILTPTAKENSTTAMYFQKSGAIGIGTETPRTQLEVNGTLGMNARIGTYKLGSVRADGNWHTIADELNGCVAFEVLAQVGKKNTGKYALLHAHALSTFGRSHHRIRRTQAHYGWFWNKIAIRFSGKIKNFKLEVKTRSDYGVGHHINFYMTKLWDTDTLNFFNKNE
ncbi:hypothetical protein [Spongiimicrobium salis]|uniref:hypothetical protein n=1 Tax=Spongiimicrobium salis TaxID=1667022 RepID=UPI00374DAEAE